MSRFNIGSVTFYVDEDLDSDQFVKPIRAAGFRLVRHRQVLPPGTPDEVWIPSIARKGWFALSHNREISYLRSQRDLVMREGLGLFLVRGQTRHEGHPFLAGKVVGAKTSIANFVHKNYRPFIASIIGPQGKKQRYRCEGRKPEDRAWNAGKMEARQQLRNAEEPPPGS